MNREQAVFHPARTGLSGFQSKLNTSLCQLDYTTTTRSQRFSTSFEGVRLGALDVLRFDGYGLNGRRTFRHIREDGIDDFLLILPLTTPVSISQKGQMIVLNPNECTLVSTLQPFEGICCMPLASQFSEFVVRIPGSILRQHIPHADVCCVRRMDTRSGAGRVLSSLLDVLVEERHGYSEAHGKRFGKMLLEAVANVTAQTLALTEFAYMHKSAHSRVFAQATEYIDNNLSNLALNPALVAGHCRISVGYLHAAFASSSRSVNAYIRETRLSRCREALQNPLLRHQSIIEIAMRWGFDSASTFSHAYRKRYGASPSKDRAAIAHMCAVH